MGIFLNVFFLCSVGFETCITKHGDGFLFIFSIYYILVSMATRGSSSDFIYTIEVTNSQKSLRRTPTNKSHFPTT